MAGRIFTVNFDEGIEKVEYAGSLYDFPTGEVTTSGQTIAGQFELYVRPIFKQGYELDTTNAKLATGESDIYAVSLTDSELVTFTSKPSGGGRHYDL